MSLLLLIPLAILLALVLGAYILYIQPLFPLYLQSLLSGAHIPFTQLVSLRFQKLDTASIVINSIRLKKAGILSITTNDLIAHSKAGGDLNNAVSCMITAISHDIPLQWHEIKALDLAGVNVLRLAVDARANNDLAEIEQLLERHMDDIAAHLAHNQL